MKTKIACWSVWIGLLWVFSVSLNASSAQRQYALTASQATVKDCRNGIDEGCGVPIGARCGHSPENRCQHGLTCRFHKRGAREGVCKVPTARPCVVGMQMYKHGAKFSPNCRTQCICHNGTYACASRCPNENITPRGTCAKPQLVEMPGRCCREWVCESAPAATATTCHEESSPWGDCSRFCGGGLSYRVSNANPSCRTRNESRLCQRQSCMEELPHPHYSSSHHPRKRHSCKAIQRLSGVRLRIGPCVSQRRYAPRHCGPCPQPDICCRPSTTTTIQVEMICNNLPRIDEETEDIHQFFGNMVKPGDDVWVLEKNSSKSREHKHHHSINRRSNFGHDNSAKNNRPLKNEDHFLSRSYPYYRILTDVYILKMEWILKCECGRNICPNMPLSEKIYRTMNQFPDDSQDAEKILVRVHRTAP